MPGLNALILSLALLVAQPAQGPSIAVDPPSPGAADVHWTISLSAPFCGGFRIGDGVYLQPESPLALPAVIPADAVRFDGQPAAVSLDAGVLRVTPSPTLAQPMLCRTGAQPFTVELLSSLGLTNPGPGDYLVDVWFGTDSPHQSLPVTIAEPPAASASATACSPLQQSVDAATATLQTDNAALATTFDAIRAQANAVPSQTPELAATQTELVRQLDQVQASGKSLAADGWNPSIAIAAPAIEWAQAAAQADITALEAAAAQLGGASHTRATALVSLVQGAQQQAQDADAASLRLTDVLMQLGDCGLGVPPAGPPIPAPSDGGN